MTQNTPRYEQSNQCPECKRFSLVMDHIRAEIVCQYCGYVAEGGLMYAGPDACDYGDKPDRVHNGPALNRFVPGSLTTEISYSNRDAGKRNVTNARMMNRLRRLQHQSRLKNGAERSLASAEREIERVCGNLQLPRDYQDTLRMYYRTASKKGLIKGRSIPLTVASLAYAVCRKYGQPRTFDEVSAASGIKVRDLGRSYRSLKCSFKWKFEQVDPALYVPRFCTKLNLSEVICSGTIQYINEKGMNELKIGRSPVSVAAAAIHVVAGKAVTQTEISKVTGISEVTIRTISRSMKATA